MFINWSKLLAEFSYNFCNPLAFLVAQTVKNPPTMQETCVQSLGWKDPLEKGMAMHSRILAWEIPGTGEPAGAGQTTVHGVAKSQTRLSR